MENQSNLVKDLDGKIALVTGGTKGIGKAVVNRLKQAGATVITTARKQSDGDASDHFIAADLSLPDDVKQVANEVEKIYGGVDILINNMGANTFPGGGFSRLSDGDWDQAFQINLMSSVRLDRALLPLMLGRKNATIIHISSTSSRIPIWESTMAYSAAKAALNAYSKSLSDEVAPQGLRVNTVSPGLTKTEAMAAFLNDLAQNANSTVDEITGKLFERLGGVPLGRMAEPEETAELIYFLASSKASYITGGNYHIDGGNFPVVG
jgi:NAD(P)-dependent dehydrogenase (short-subunit alcohol dehydrogenase family)